MPARGILLARLSEKRLVQPGFSGWKRRSAKREKCGFLRKPCGRRPVSSASFRAGEKQHPHGAGGARYRVQRFRKIHIFKGCGDKRPSGPDRSHLSGGKLSGQPVPDFYFHGAAGQSGERRKLLYCGNQSSEADSGRGACGSFAGALFCGRGSARDKYGGADRGFHPGFKEPAPPGRPLLCGNPRH